MQPLALSQDGKQLLHNLEAADRHKTPHSDDLIHISGVGSNLYFAYEQLRNAAEYSERHLLQRRAIERFLHRNLNLREHTSPLGWELVSELTHSRYLKNDSIPRPVIHAIDEVIQRYVRLANAVRQHHSVGREQLTSWIFQAASVEIEHLLVDHSQIDGFIDFVWQHYREHIDSTRFSEFDEEKYHLALYMAVHRTLFKSDTATIRFYALAARLGPKGGNSLDYFVAVNEMIDDLQRSPLVNRLGRLVNRYGAPMRILREILMNTGDPQAVIRDRGELMARITDECRRQYKSMRKRLNEGIVRSVIFIFITKVLLGVAIEVPYDILTVGAVVWMPLAINTLFPPVYMATLGWGIRTPGKRNTEVIQLLLGRILYQSDEPPVTYRIRRRVTSSAVTKTFNGVYAVGFLLSIAVLAYILYRLHFNIVQGGIFFIFLSVVSFLGFRLLQTSRELEIVDQQKSLWTVATDFFYTPFIRIGNWLSDQYSRVNIVTFVLDLAIELPLKTSLRMIQQWVGFVRDKQEEI